MPLTIVRRVTRLVLLLAILHSSWSGVAFAFIEGTYTGVMHCTSMYNEGTVGPFVSKDTVTLTFGSGGIYEQQQQGSVLMTHTEQTTGGSYLIPPFKYSALINADGKHGMVALHHESALGPNANAAIGTVVISPTATKIKLTSNYADDFGGVLQTCKGVLKRTSTVAPKIVFVTSTAYDGNLGGLAGADQKCNDSAFAAGLWSSFQAFLSSSSVSVNDRFSTKATVPYVLVDTTKIADNWTDLTDGTLQAPINGTEFGYSLLAADKVWTNTDAYGNLTSNSPLGHCTDWSVAGGPGDTDGIFGDSSHTDSTWSQESVASCASSYRLYCVEQ